MDKRIVTSPLCGAAVAERLTCSPPTGFNPQLGHSPDIRTWDSCRTMPLVGGFSRGYPISHRSFIPELLHTHLASPSSALKTSLLPAVQISLLTHLLFCTPLVMTSRLVAEKLVETTPTSSSLASSSPEPSTPRAESPPEISSSTPEAAGAGAASKKSGGAASPPPAKNPALQERCNSEELRHVVCHLETKDLWDKFNDLGTEMIITKSGRWVHSRTVGNSAPVNVHTRIVYPNHMQFSQKGRGFTSVQQPMEKRRWLQYTECLGIVPDDAVGRRVYLGDLPFTPPFHSGAAPYSLQSPSSSALKSSMLGAAQISSFFTRVIISRQDILQTPVLLYSVCRRNKQGNFAVSCVNKLDSTVLCEPAPLYRGDVVVRVLASHQGEPGSIPRRVSQISALWETCRRMPLVGGFFSRISRSPPPPPPYILRSCAAPYLPRFTHISSQCLDVETRPNLFALQYSAVERLGAGWRIVYQALIGESRSYTLLAGDAILGACALGSPSTVAAGNQCAVDIDKFVNKTVDSSLEVVIDLADLSDLHAIGLEARSQFSGRAHPRSFTSISGPASIKRLEAPPAYIFFASGTAGYLLRRGFIVPVNLMGTAGDSE
ncbi:hypothetical protein PR048_033371 [Dryococelus australis]|uniref:T-box domain-containing protein n=1 Tax=Dryococelus australis TaxID=614101 RepID=A0ABQ9G039_9NEOP|nr:hypothetical protein PR048_033371 [Dryococelus australis]